MLHIHIGRGKAGSTTIQQYVLENRDALRERGVIYATLWPGETRHAAVKRAVRRANADQSPLDATIAEVATRPDLTWLISDEAMFHGAEHDLSRARRLVDVPGHDVQIICYIRRYDDWIRSVYAQTAKTATRQWDFDTFYALSTNRRTPARSRLSIMPMLHLCAELVGWSRVRVRSLEPLGLHGGTLIADLLHGIGLPDDTGLPTTIENRNVAPTWMVVEFRRAVSLALGEHADHRVAKLLMRAFARSAAGSPNGQSAAVYLTPGQAREARALYNEDVSLINELSGSQIRLAPEATLPMRPFLPSIEHVPADIREAFLSSITERHLRTLSTEQRDGVRRLQDMMSGLDR